jgi:hypothetical protein
MRTPNRSIGTEVVDLRGWLEIWLGDLDSNQDSQIQNLESYRWTISQQLP